MRKSVLVLSAGVAFMLTGCGEKTEEQIKTELVEAIMYELKPQKKEDMQRLQNFVMWYAMQELPDPKTGEWKVAIPPSQVPQIFELASKSPISSEVVEAVQPADEWTIEKSDKEGFYRMTYSKFAKNKRTGSLFVARFEWDCSSDGKWIKSMGSAPAVSKVKETVPPPEEPAS